MSPSVMTSFPNEMSLSWADRLLAHLPELETNLVSKLCPSVGPKQVSGYNYIRKTRLTRKIFEEWKNRAFEECLPRTELYNCVVEADES